jgi:hypothetical protein
VNAETGGDKFLRNAAYSVMPVFRSFKSSGKVISAQSISALPVAMKVVR